MGVVAVVVLHNQEVDAYEGQGLAEGEKIRRNSWRNKNLLQVFQSFSGPALARGIIKHPVERMSEIATIMTNLYNIPSLGGFLYS